MATQQETNLLTEGILKPVGEAAGVLPAEELTGFLAMEGSRYNVGPSLPT